MTMTQWNTSTRTYINYLTSNNNSGDSISSSGFKRVNIDIDTIK